MRQKRAMPLGIDLSEDIWGWLVGQDMGRGGVGRLGVLGASESNRTV